MYYNLRKIITIRTIKGLVVISW